MGKVESQVINGYAQFLEAEKNGFTKKQWRTMRDKRVRESHSGMEGKIIELYDVFNVHGYKMLFPCDTETDNPDPSEIVGCRCSLKYLK